MFTTIYSINSYSLSEQAKNAEPIELTTNGGSVFRLLRHD